MKRPAVLEGVWYIVFVAGVIHQSLARPSQRAETCGYEVVSYTIPIRNVPEFPTRFF